jgi:hypothetical protein
LTKQAPVIVSIDDVAISKEGIMSAADVPLAISS